jgi:uncharacterized small protein (DUF1192 family)
MPRDFKAKNGRSARRGRVGPGFLGEVGAVEAGGCHFDQDLAGARHRHRQVHEPEGFSLFAMGGCHHCGHRAPLSSGIISVFGSLLARLSAFLNRFGRSSLMAVQDEDPVIVKRTLSLDQMSVGDLEERIANLKTEIAACEAEIEKKKSQKRAADALFGGGS